MKLEAQVNVQMRVLGTLNVKPRKRIIWKLGVNT